MSKTIRCAIYTRKSHEEGLDQDFNSLDAQREAGEAYIKSQKHEGWQLIQAQYNDGGFSGGTMQRPALQQLLADIKSGTIDVVVVYKVDRLSRALGDFAQMVEIFDAHNVSFVSVTQPFNTTTSMGRLTLNVLLSFAQFEREVTGERIRDKFAASKKKGIWMGGRQPLGYDVVDRKLIINKAEARIITDIFTDYANNSSGAPLHQLLSQWTAKGYRNKSYVTQKGRQVIGGELTLAQIYRILNNPLYLGKLCHKGEVHVGEHGAIITQELWDRAHQKMDKKHFSQRKSKSEQPKLAGKLYDYCGHRLSPTYSYKYSANGRYKMRYYINREIASKGKTTSEFKRIRAEYVDDAVLEAVQSFYESAMQSIHASPDHAASALLKPLKQLAASPIEHVRKVVLFPKHMELALLLAIESHNLTEASIESLLSAHKAKANINDQHITITFHISAHYKRCGGKLLIASDNSQADVSAQHHYPDDKSFTMIAKSFYWNRQIDHGVYRTQKDIAAAQNHSPEYVKRACKLAFLSPRLIEHITSQNTSQQLHIEDLIACHHWDWQSQEQALLPAA
jgi:site-specific DNA recombinase